MRQIPTRKHERGTLIVVILFVATAIGALAAISASRVVTESNHQAVLEDESRAFIEAHGRIHMALNMVNNSAYDDQNRNLVLRDAIAVSADDLAGAPEWLQDPDGVTHGILAGSGVRVYRGRDYVKRLAKIKGLEPSDVDPLGESDAYFVLEGVGRSGETVRMVSALVRENEPFSAFVFFQNQHTLGVSGAPRGLIHTNADLAFYFQNGSYVDPVFSSFAPAR